MPIKPGPRAGDWIEARGVHGQPPRRGEIVEVLGSEGHEHYRVHWDEKHESIVYPADGVVISSWPRSARSWRRPQVPRRMTVTELGLSLVPSPGAA